MAIAVQEIFGEAGPSERPFLLAAPEIPAHDIEHQLRTLRHAVLNPLQPVIEPTEIEIQIIELRVAELPVANDGSRGRGFRSAMACGGNDGELIVAPARADSVCAQQVELQQRLG